MEKQELHRERLLHARSAFGGESAAAMMWDEEGSFPIGFANASVSTAAVGMATGRYAKTTLPVPHRVDMGAELASIRRILTEPRADDAILIEIALDEAQFHLEKAHPCPDKIGGSLQRALDLASRDENFDARREALIPPLRHACAWLGGPWYRLLGFVNLTF